MFPLLPKFILNNETPAFYEAESGTAIEMVARLHATMNELITEYNNFADTVNERVEQFITTQGEDFETFKTSIRQEFQDFINVVDLKVTGYEGTISQTVLEYKTEITNLFNTYRNELEGIGSAIDEVRSNALTSDEVAELRNMAATLESTRDYALDARTRILDREDEIDQMWADHQSVMEHVSIGLTLEDIAELNELIGE